MHSILAVGHEDSLACVRTFRMQVTENSAQTWHKLKTSAQVAGQSRETHMHLRVCVPVQGRAPLCLPQLFTVLVLFLGRFYKWLLKMPPTAVAPSLPDRKRGSHPYHAVSARDLVLTGLSWVTCPCITLSPWGWGWEGWRGGPLWRWRGRPL